MIWTIGHGAIEADDLVALLQKSGISLLVDVRSVPYSRFAGQFNADVLAALLPAKRVRYVGRGQALGGRPEDPEQRRPDGKPDYDRMAESRAFRAALDELISWAREERVCLMCSEEDPARCHRSLLLADQLTRQGCAVTHIRHDGRTETQPEVVKRRTGGQLVLF